MGYSQTNKPIKPKADYSQNADGIVEYIIESVAENLGEDFDYTEMVDRLNYYRKYPINLNKTSKAQLLELVFLNQVQINNLLTHIQKNGKLINVLELQGITGFDLETIKNLLYFSTISQPTGFENFSFKNMLIRGNGDVLVRYQRVIEPQKGYNIPDSSKASRYLGPPDRIFTRFRYNYNNNVLLSINVEKDAGEQYWATSGKKGPDFYSGSLYLKDIRAFKKIVIGDFALQFGQGLTMWSGLSFGKGADIFTVARQDLGLRSYTSVNEFSFFRGLATQVNLGKFEFTPFVSSINIDASAVFNPVTLTDEIGSLQQSGLHRTASELKGKGRINQLVYGSNLQYKTRQFNVGLIGYQTTYSERFAPNDAVYSKYDFTSNHLTNIGLHYNYNIKNTYFYGEAAHSVGHGFAFINGLISSLSPAVSMVAFHRNYQKNYQSYFNQAISENTIAKNEKGFYTGLQIKPSKKFEWVSYFDMFKFPWLKFSVDAPSGGFDVFSQFSYIPNKVTRFSLRYRIRDKEQNSPLSTNINFLEPYRRQNFRLEAQYQVNKSFTLRNRVEVMAFKEESDQQRYGFMAYQDVNYNPLSSKFSGNMRLTMFQTENFDTRIYAYESDVLYGFSIPAYQNQGIRFYVNGRYTVRRGLDFWIRYALTQYSNLTTIGSGLDEINGNQKSEIKLQARIQF
ncbi:MAG: hypothetical protein EAZ51_05215 [Sphingobacteriales bacterium]|nr:MAG: hypothetical protein EAZ64_03050 [Sphingobacteriales bacterium]TAF80871.1 MAG: hypothetical protein EAZ51_05215 [Sphingobacteriales bacterium]